MQKSIINLLIFAMLSSWHPATAEGVQPVNNKDKRIAILQDERLNIVNELNRLTELSSKKPKDEEVKKGIGQHKLYLSMIDKEIELAQKQMPSFYKASQTQPSPNLIEEQKTKKEKKGKQNQTNSDPNTTEQIASQDTKPNQQEWDVFNNFN